jgi:hypothetical protein
MHPHFSANRLVVGALTSGRDARAPFHIPAALTGDRISRVLSGWNRCLVRDPVSPGCKGPDLSRGAIFHQNARL